MKRAADRPRRRWRRGLVGAAVALAAAFVVTEYLYYFPLTPLSLDIAGRTRLPAAGAKTLRLLFVGDVLLGDAGRSTVESRGPDYIFGATRPLIRSADLAVGNLEGPIARRCARRDKRWSYRMEPSVAPALARAGFDAMDLANNHILDCGPPGVVESISWLRRAGVVPLGAGESRGEAHRPAIFKRRGVTLAVLGYQAPELLLGGRRATTAEHAAAEGRPGAAWGELERVVDDVHRARQQADLVLAVVHLGGRYQRQPAAFEREYCQQLVEAGADAVIAHGTHILGPVALHRGRPILYGLGNFAFGSGNVRARFSLMAFIDVDLRRRALAAVQLLPIYTVNRTPWVWFQTKVLVGRQARRVLGELARSSRSLGASLRLMSEPARAVLRLPPR